MKIRLSRREGVKTAIGGLIVLGTVLLFGGSPLYAKEPYDLGDLTITWAGVQMFYLPCEVAKAKGFFEEEGIKVGKFFTSKGGSSTVRNIVDGGLPMGECSADSAVMAISKRKEPFKLVAGGVISTGSIAWVVRKDSELKKIQDLKGKTISFTRAGSVTEAVVALTLEAAPGISPSDVKRIASGGVGAGLTLLDKGEVDAAMCSYPTMLGKGAKFRVLFFARDFVPDYFQTFWMARESFLKEHPDIMRGFLRARGKGVKYIRENPKYAAEILVKTNEGIRTMEAAMETMKHEGILDGIAFSDNRFSKKGLENVVKGMKVVGSIAPDVDVPWAEIIDQSYLEESKRITLP
ncbi:MAG: ABC transporter substrate-binding protein [Pseudomonadota bacterium]